MKKNFIFVILGSVLFVLLLASFITWRILEMSSLQIEDTNGIDTAIVTFDIKNCLNSDFDSITYKSSYKRSGVHSKKTAVLSSEADYDYIEHSFGKFSGTIILQETEVSGSVNFTIENNIEEGNFEICIYKNDVFVQVLHACENGTYSFNGAGVYSIVICGESAKGSISVQRNLNNSV